MKKRIGFVIMMTIIALVILLLVWRLWPHSISNVISVDGTSVTSFSSVATVYRIENGQTITDTYRIDNLEHPGSEAGELLDILATSHYRQDFRNLSPWNLDYVDADKNYDGRMVLLIFSVGNQADEHFEIQFTSKSTILVFIGGDDEFRLYHPTNHMTLDALIEYFQTHGTKQ